MKRLILLHILLSIFCIIGAQNTGVSGKRGVLKTNLVNYITEKGGNVALEYALTKNFSMEFEFRRMNKNMLPLYSSYTYQDEKVIPGKKFNVKGNFYSLCFKLYTRNDFNAPKGVFFYAKAGLGNATIHGYTAREATDPFGQEITEYIYFKESKVKYLPLEFGGGKQWVFGKYISFEVSAGYNLTYNINKGDVKLSEGVSQRVGPNFIPISGHYILSYSHGKLAHGMAFSVRLGFLIP